MADTGYPVKIGCPYNFTGNLTGLTATWRSDCQADQYGNMRVALTALAAAPVDTAINVDLPFKDSSNSSGAPLGVAAYAWSSTKFVYQRVANTVARLPSAAASTNSTSVKASAAFVCSITGVNTTAAIKYIKLYNKASAPTVGTDTPFMTIAMPVSNTTFNMNFPGFCLYMTTGFAYALTGAAADNDTTALSAGDVVGLNFTYQ